MADFTVEDRGPLQGNVSVKAPVVDTGTVDALRTVGKSVNTLFSVADDIHKAQKTNVAASNMGSLGVDLNNLNEAISQGKLSPRQAGTKARALVNAFTANHPGETAKAHTLFNKIISGEVRQPTNDAGLMQKARQALVSEAASLNLINEYMSDEERESALINLSSIKREREIMSDAQKEITLRTGQTNLSKAELSLREAQNKDRSLRFLDAEGEHITLATDNQIKKIQRAFTSDPNFNEQTAIVELETLRSSITAQINGTAGAAGNERIKLVTGPIDKMIDLAKAQVGGKITKDVFENRLAIQKSRITSKLLENEELANFYGRDQILSNTGLQDIFKNMKSIEEAFTKQSVNGGKVANLWSLSNSAEKDVYRVMKNAVSSDVVDANDKEAHTTQLDVVFNNMLRSTDRFSADIQGPKEFNEAVDFYATPEFAKWVKRGNMNPEDAKGAERVYQELYLQEAAPVIEEKWENVALHRSFQPSAGGVKDDALQSNIGVEWTETGVKFAPLQGGRRSFNEATQRRVNELNKELGPLVNKLVRAGAHLGGNTDYQKVFDKTFGDIFDLEDDQADTGKSLDEFKNSKGDTFSKSTGALVNSLVGASEKTDPKAHERMGHLLENEFATLADTFQTSTGKKLNINDAIAKKGTSREEKTPNSRHFHGDALDISLKGLTDDERIALISMAKEAGFTGFGFGDTILHVDKGRNRGWAYGNNKFAGQDVAELIKNIKG